jgi:hypothetical protein
MTDLLNHIKLLLKMLKLSEYPSAIADASMAVNDADAQITKLRRLIVQAENAADVEVAYALDLKNDNQRKARRLEILNSDLSYLATLQSLDEGVAEKSKKMAELERLRNEFSVIKLETRLAIAQIGVEARELAGL